MLEKYVNSDSALPVSVPLEVIILLLASLLTVNPPPPTALRSESSRGFLSLANSKKFHLHL